MNNVPYDKKNLLCVDYTSNIGVYILIVSAWFVNIFCLKKEHILNIFYIQDAVIHFQKHKSQLEVLW